MNRYAPTRNVASTGSGTEQGPLEFVANGEPRRVAPGTTVAEFLAAHDLSPDLVVVERNGTILRRAELDTIALRTGDTLEIVHFVGGG
jgi:thiamine biosynthesis protein ThiS